MVPRIQSNIRYYTASILYGAALIVTLIGSMRDLFDIYVHRLLVVLRECGGFPVFEGLSRAPRHVCLVIARPSRSSQIERAVRTLQSAGCERVTVCHDGSLVISCDGFSEVVTQDMGKSSVVNQVRAGSFGNSDVSYPDAILVLSGLSDSCPTMFSTSMLQLEQCMDASIIYYAELIPLYSLNPSDVFLAVSMFQSKSQRFGK